MEKRRILDEIRRIAKENQGKAPGSKAFETATGIGRYTWYPHYWLRWGEAVIEAGLAPNQFNERFDEEFLIDKYIELTREVGCLPIKGHFLRKRKADKESPNEKTFDRFGGKSELIQRVIAHCRTRGGFEDIITLGSEYLSHRPTDNLEAATAVDSFGYVYLVRHGSRKEYKIGRTNNLMRREGELGIELPEKGEPIHTIKTDDPSGVERYWHQRFKDKRKNGEWFELTASDVKAFKKWKRIF